jgi:hypothetical protein
MVASNAKEIQRQRNEEGRNLTLARRGLTADLAPDLHVADRAIRVAAYRQQVEAAGRIIRWLPAQAMQRDRDMMLKKGRQYRW